VARAGGSETRWKQSLGFLSDSTKAQASWHRYFWQSPYVKKRLADIGLEHRQVLGSKPAAGTMTQPGSTSNAAEPKPLVSAAWEEEKERTLFEELIQHAFPFNSHFLSDESRVRASLETPRKPFWTNGQWTAEQRRVEWSTLIAELPKPNRDASVPSFEWPTLCFAAWDEPNEEQQKKQFGNVGLTGHALLDYCTWYAGLSALEKREWEAFLPSVKKGEQPAIRLKAFRFSNERADRKNDQSVASDGAGIIQGVIYPEKR
jgi:hypothetical protein